MWLGKWGGGWGGLKSLIRFHSANKCENYNRGGKTFKNPEEYRTSQNIRMLNVFLESLLSESFPSLGITVHLTSLGCPPTLCWSLDLLWGSSDSNLVLLVYSCLQCPQLSELVHFLLRELSMSFYIFHRHSLPTWSCGFNLQLYSLWEDFGSSFLSHTAPGFQL